MTRYKKVPDKQNKRFDVVDENSFGIQKISSSNLNNRQEFKVRSLAVEGCPMEKNGQSRMCITLYNGPNDGVNSICDFLETVVTCLLPDKSHAHVICNFREKQQ